MKRVTLLVLVIGIGLLVFGASASMGVESTEEAVEESVAPVEESVVTAEESADPFTTQNNSLLEEDFNEVEYEEFRDELDELASVSVIELLNNETVGENDEEPETELSEEEREAAEEGAIEGIELAQEQGVNVTQSQQQAVIDSAVRSAIETEDAPAEKIRAATKGATHGAIIQNQEVNITQIQAGIYGSSAGALSQFQNASVTQLQSAAYGAAHGTVAQHQHANVTQIQYAAVGAAAGATHSAVQTQLVSVTQIQEAAQGGGYGSLVQAQEVTVTQIQAAAFGAAGGGAEKGDSPTKDPKKVQEATMGAAQGALVEVEEASVTQIQAAARGASKGALSQYQHASVTQIQQSSKGAAKGAISQHQVANVRQIQAAATGGAHGTLTQIQRVDIVQIQHAAVGAARGAAKSAAQYQVVNVQQIQAAAAGAGQGSVIQIQQVNIRQVQVIAESAATGALSQHQHASVVQIQQAARGASDGALSITQIQVVTITQIQIISERTAADTARTAADTDIDHGEKIYKHAKGDAEDPERDEDPDLKSLFFDVEDETLFLANPNDVAVTVTATSDGTVETITLSPGEMLTRQLEPGSYTLTAESADDRTVKLSGRESIRIAISEEPESLTADVDDQVLRLTNPNDQHATVTVRDEQGGHVLTVDVSPTGDRTYQLEPGTYTLTAVLADDRPVQINDEDETTVTVAPEELYLGVTVENQTVTIQNPGETDVTVTATDNETGDEEEITVAAGATESQTLEPGTYTLTGEAEDDRLVLLNGETELSITLTEGPPEAIDLSATVDNQTLSLENPAETEVTVTAIDENDEQQTFEVAANDNTSEELEPGNYTLTGEAADDRPVTLNGETELSITLTEGPPEAIDLSATVDNQTLSLENPAETEVTITATDEDDEQQAFEVGAEDNTSEEIEPGNYTLTGEAADDRPVTLNGEAELSISIGEPSPGTQIDSCRVIDEPGEYELTSDLAPEEEGTCLEVTVEDVTIDGNGYTIDGTAVSGQAGIHITTFEDEVPESNSVRIYSANITGWEMGIWAGNDESPVIEDTHVVANQHGVVVGAGSRSTLTNVTLEANEGDGFLSDMAGTSTITNSTIQENGNGVFAGDGSTIELESSVVQNNNDGVTVTGSSTTISNTTVTGNSNIGIAHFILADLTLENVTVSENDGLELGQPDHTLEGTSTLNATDLVVGEVAALDFNVTSSRLSLDTVQQGTFPVLDDARAAGDGLNVTDLNGTADLRLEFDDEAVGEDETVELWRHDSIEWLPVENTTVTEATLEATIDDDGVYAPVVPTEEPLDTQIDSCRVIDEPGEYELTSDLQPEEDETCLEITVSNVTIDGNEHSIAGPESPNSVEGNGIQVSRADEDENGIIGEEGAITDVRIHNVQVMGWADGIHIDEFESADIENATVGENQRGVFIANEGIATVRDTTLEGNEEIGLYATLRGDVTITNSTIQENAHGMTTHEGSVLEMNASVVQNNDGNGMTVPETEASITDTMIVGNDGVGLGHWMTFSLELNNVTVSDNSGWQLGPATMLGAPSSTFAVTDIHVDEIATLSFDFSATLALDVDEQETMPDIENARTVGDGLNATNLEGTADLRLEFDGEAVDEEESVELQRYDGTDWLPVEDVTVTDDALEASIDESGLYAPVVSEELPDVELNVTVDEQTVAIENPAETQVTVTAVADATDELVQTIPVQPESTASEEFEPGNYTLTGEADDDQQVTLNGEAELGITVEELQEVDLNVTVGEETVTISNPSDVPTTVTATNDETGEEQVVDVPADGTVTETLEAGSYTLTGQAADDRPVTLNGDAQFSLTIEGLQEAALDVTVDEETVTITNPSETPVTVTATNDETGEEQVVDVPADGTVTETLEAGSYTLTGEAEDDRSVTLNGETALTVTIEAVQ